MGFIQGEGRNQGALASFDDPDLVIQAVLDGVGIGTAMEDSLQGLICRRTLGSSPERLVPIFSRIFSLLSQPSESTCCAGCAY